jgi:hypothetical protein
MYIYTYISINIHIYICTHLGHSYVFHWEVSVQVLCPFFHLIGLVLGGVIWVLYIFCISIPPFQVDRLQCIVFSLHVCCLSLLLISSLLCINFLFCTIPTIPLVYFSFSYLCFWVFSKKRLPTQCVKSFLLYVLPVVS